MGKLIVTEGNTYVATSTYKGDKGNGPFEIFRIKDDTGKNELSCFVATKSFPQNITQGDRVKINKIVQVEYGWKKKQLWSKDRGKYEDWVHEATLSVECVRLSSDLEDVPGDLPDFEEQFTDGDLPWDDGDLPL